MLTPISAVTAIALPATLISAGAVPPNYSATVLPQLDTTDSEFKLTYTTPFAMNDSRVVTGDLGSRLGFVWSPAEGGMLLQPQFARQADEAVGTGVNAAGDVVGGYFQAGAFQGRAFHFSAADVFTPLPSLDDGLAASAADINDSGMIVGEGENAPGGGTFGGPTSAVYWIDGRIHEIGGLGGFTSYAAAVNNNRGYP